MNFRRWLREPLVHFLALGALIFGAYTALNDGTDNDREIVVSVGQQEHLLTTFTRTWQRPPTPEEFQGLVEDWIRQEIAYREGQAMGLDSGDTVIRRRLRQKLELLAEDVVDLDEPTEQELQAFLERNQDVYEAEARYNLRQVYFSPDRRGDEAVRDAEQALVLLSSGDLALDPALVGDPLPLPHRLDDEAEGALARQFGRAFAKGLEGLPLGEWSGPVESGFGLHLVQLEARRAGRPLSLEEARSAVARDLVAERRQAAIDRLYERLAERYTISVEPLADELEPAGP